MNIYFYKYISPKFQDREPHTKDEIIPGKKSTKIQPAQIVQTRPLDSTWGKLPKTKVGGDPEISWNSNKWVHTPAPLPLPTPKTHSPLLPNTKITKNNPLILSKAQKWSKFEIEKQLPDPHLPTYPFPPHPPTYQLPITTDGPVEIPI